MARHEARGERQTEISPDPVRRHTRRTPPHPAGQHRLDRQRDDEVEREKTPGLRLE
jgi:hypothetical protein